MPCAFIQIKKTLYWIRLLDSTRRMSHAMHPNGCQSIFQPRIRQNSCIRNIQRFKLQMIRNALRCCWSHQFRRQELYPSTCDLLWIEIAWNITAHNTSIIVGGLCTQFTIALTTTQSMFTHYGLCARSSIAKRCTLRHVQLSIRGILYDQESNQAMRIYKREYPI
jgi:hypothetical protein